MSILPSRLEWWLEAILPFPWPSSTGSPKCLALSWLAFCLKLSLSDSTIPSEMTGFGASILEGMMTFGLVYTVYASVDARRGAMGGIRPLAVRFIMGANVLASGPFTGGSMNPACAFGAALIGGSFKNQAVYWVGPLIGVVLAGILYDNVVFPVQATDSLRGVSEGVGDI